MPALRFTRRWLEALGSATCPPLRSSGPQEGSRLEHCQVGLEVDGFLPSPTVLAWVCGEGVQDNGLATPQGHHSQMSLTDYPVTGQTQGMPETGSSTEPTVSSTVLEQDAQ